MNRVTKRRQQLPNFLGLLSSLCFFFGSLLFLPNSAIYATVGVWCFVMGSLIMFIIYAMSLKLRVKNTSS
ncbi:YrhK family protein [Vreelandella zhaodongensis]|uniref:YrhK family protein n=1 Tax=Vreelandella zhaodongensis TaxID=1176240 RepID=A0ABX2SVM1_VREZH|nr:YrhK family protein [Halomonas zhaodongensis]NYS45610.1 YrhK family protein [Halomonas zhaodongensis]